MAWRTAAADSSDSAYIVRGMARLTAWSSALSEQVARM